MLDISFSTLTPTLSSSLIFHRKKINSVFWFYLFNQTVKLVLSLEQLYIKYCTPGLTVVYTGAVLNCYHLR